jgi:predicted DNA-binding transcriptional regulator YafY
MKADRLLSTLLLLQAHGRLTGRQLADRLEVSPRTVHRDMDALSAAGVPVYALRGSRGGWRLEEDWRTQVPGLDEAELRALLMAQPRVIGEGRLAAAAERAMGKLLAALPSSLRERANAIRQRLHVDATGWRGTSENVDALPLVQEAVSRDQKLRMRYRKTGSETVLRTVDPLGLVAKGSAWYLVAQTPNGLRTYRVSRIEEATILPRPSVRPPGFDLAAYWQASTEKLREGWSKYAATLRLDPRATAKMDEWRAGAPGEGPDGFGWTIRTVSFDDEEQACFVVLGLGPRVEVIGPDSLRRRVARDTSAMAARLGRSRP